MPSSSDTGSSQGAILSALRVLDFGRYIAGPYCGALLADLGADVIRVEKVDGGEDRFLAPITPEGDGAMFLQCNRGKRGLTLNPMKPAGREVMRRLLASADIVIANLPPRGLEAMGLDYATLEKIRPEIILVALDAFGPEGPWAGRVGFDAVGQAMSGAMYLSGAPGEPAKSIVNYVDYSTALSATIGVLAAVIERGRTGRGRVVRGSLLRSSLALAGAYLTEQAVTRVDRVASGNRSQFSGPSDVFPTRDGWVVVQVVGQPLFERWARAIGAPELIADPRFATDAQRGDHGALLSERMAEWCRSRRSDAVLAELDAAGVPAAPVLSPQQALEHPQIAASGYLRPAGGAEAPLGPPISVAPFDLGAGSTMRGPAPKLGEHTDAILQTLGYTGAEIAELRRHRVV